MAFRKQFTRHVQRDGTAPISKIDEVPHEHDAAVVGGSGSMSAQTTPTSAARPPVGPSQYLGGPPKQRSGSIPVGSLMPKAPLAVQRSLETDSHVGWPRARSSLSNSSAESIAVKMFQKSSGTFQHMRNFKTWDNISRLSTQGGSSLSGILNATTKLSDSTALVMKIAPGAEKISQQLNQYTDDVLLFAKCLLAHTCYDLVPTSAKLIVFDSQLAVKKAFLGLIYNGVRAAPVWDAEKQDFVGMLTVSDFIRILELNYHSSHEQLDQLEEQKISEWRETLAGELKPFIWISPDASLFDAVKALLDYKVHRLPVMNPRTGNVLYILTHKRILKFLMMYLNQWLRLDISGYYSEQANQGDRMVVPGNRGIIDLQAMSQPVRPVSPGGGCPMPEVFNQTLGEVKDQLGSYENIATVTTNTTIIDALRMFNLRRVSALPVVDAERHVANIYAKFDVISLAADKTYDKLDAPIREVLEHRNEWFEGVKTCKLTDRLRDVLYLIVKAEVHRLVVADDNNTLIGVVSLSDILNFLVLKPLRKFNISIDDYDPLASSVSLYQSSVQAMQSMSAIGEQWSSANMSDVLSVGSGALSGYAPNGNESSVTLESATG